MDLWHIALNMMALWSFVPIMVDGNRRHKVRRSSASRGFSTRLSRGAREMRKISRTSRMPWGLLFVVAFAGDVDDRVLPLVQPRGCGLVPHLERLLRRNRAK